MLLNIRIFFKLIADIFYGYRAKLINKLGLYPWDYTQDTRKANKLQAKYKKLGKKPDEDD